MNYYHVIYTSSQKNLNGNNGFGIRNATEGMPPAVLKAVEEAIVANKFANDVTNCNAPLPQELLNDGTTIRRVPTCLFHAVIDVPGGQRLHAIGRNIYLGFTELFYYKDKEGRISGRGGRMGNFLIDIYLFEQEPTRDVWQLLQADAFIPADPSPSVDNAEMAAIATGEPSLLPKQEWPMQAQPCLPSAAAVNLFFALAEARFNKQKLVAKYPWEPTRQLLAELFAMLPEKEAAGITFTTNFTGNGYTLSAELNMVNEHYKAQYVGKDLFVDLEGAPLETKETMAYRQIILNDIARGDAGAVRGVCKWILSATYEKVRNLKPYTNKTLFIYTQRPGEFQLEDIEKAGEAHDELVDSLADLFRESPGQADRFLSLLNGRIDMAADVEDIVNGVRQLEFYRRKGIDVSSIVDDQRDHINAVFLDAEQKDNIKTAIKVLGLDVVRKYTNNLHDGCTWPELAQELLQIWSEQKPATLDDAARRLDAAQAQNEELHALIMQHFTQLFTPLYENISSSMAANKGSLPDMAALLREKLLERLPQQTLAGNATYQDFLLLYKTAVGNDKGAFVDEQNVRQVLPLVQKLGLAHSDVGRAVKRCLYAAPPTVEQVVEELKRTWGMHTADIIQEAVGMPRLKEFVAKALEADREIPLQQAMETLAGQGFSTAEAEDFFVRSHFASAYKAYQRKNAVSAFFNKLGGMFRKKPKTEQKPEPKTGGEPMMAGTAAAAKAPVHDAYDAPGEDSSQPERQVPVKKKNLSEKELQQVEKYLAKNKEMAVSDTVRENTEYIEKKYYEAKGSGRKLPKELERFEGLIGILLFLLLLPFGLDASAARQRMPNAYGDLQEASEKCFVVTANEAVVRTSPSIYKSKKSKKKRTDNIYKDFKLLQGDTVFMQPYSQVREEDGAYWLEFSHQRVTLYADLSLLQEEPNPHYVPVVDELTDSLYHNSGGFIGWVQRAAPWALLILTLLVFAISFAVNTPDKNSIIGEPRDSTGMRPMFMFSLRPYKFFAGLSARMLVAAICSIVVLLILGGIVWGLLWVVKILMWIVIAIGWVLLVGGIIGCFANPIAGGIVAFIGYLIVHNDEAISAFGNHCVEMGMNFFNAVNMWDFSLELVKQYWLHAVVISLTPLALFLIAAAVMMLIAGVLRSYEAVTTRHYNIKHPCPICHEPSEPAIYYDGDTEDDKLPCSLRPGIYGLLHIKHPVTGTDMPTMLANGRDNYNRKCAHCGRFIKFEAGTEHHIGFIGTPGSGKTALMSTVIGKMLADNSGMHFTDKVEHDVKSCAEHARSQGCLDLAHLPMKTPPNKMKPSIQCIMPRRDSSVPFHIYFNDVAGEVFTASGYNKELMLFSKDVENIFFVVDPFTMALKAEQLSQRMQAWLDKDDVRTERAGHLEDINTVSNSLINLLHSSRRDMGKIHFTFVLVKSDTGYLDGVDTRSPEALERFMATDLHLRNLIDSAETQYASVDFVAVSTFRKNDAGIAQLCSLLARHLQQA